MKTYFVYMKNGKEWEVRADAVQGRSGNYVFYKNGPPIEITGVFLDTETTGWKIKDDYGDKVATFQRELEQLRSVGAGIMAERDQQRAILEAIRLQALRKPGSDRTEPKEVADALHQGIVSSEAFQAVVKLRGQVEDLEDTIRDLKKERDYQINRANEIQRKYPPGTSPITDEAKEAIKAIMDERDNLARWKEESLNPNVRVPLQEIGKLMGLPLGTFIAPQILPFIKGLMADRAKGALLMTDEEQIECVKRYEAQTQDLQNKLAKMTEDRDRIRDMKWHGILDLEGKVQRLTEALSETNAFRAAIQNLMEEHPWTRGLSELGVSKIENDSLFLRVKYHHGVTKILFEVIAMWFPNMTYRGDIKLHLQAALSKAKNLGMNEERAMAQSQTRRASERKDSPSPDTTP